MPHQDSHTTLCPPVHRLPLGPPTVLNSSTPLCPPRAAAPVVTSASASYLPLAGSQIVITGSNFGATASATVGGQPCTPAGTPTATSLTCIAPPLAAGPQAVVVTFSTLASNSNVAVRYLGELKAAGFICQRAVPAGCTACCTRKCCLDEPSNCPGWGTYLHMTPPSTIL